MAKPPQQSKRGLQPDRVVLLDRTFQEYQRYFLLRPRELVGKKILDVASGVGFLRGGESPRDQGDRI
jgi:hypothetical protein